MLNKLKLVASVTYLTCMILSWVMFLSRGNTIDLVMASVSTLAVLTLLLYVGGNEKWVQVLC